LRRLTTLNSVLSSNTFRQLVKKIHSQHWSDSKIKPCYMTNLSSMSYLLTGSVLCRVFKAGIHGFQ